MSASISMSLHDNEPQALVIPCVDGRRFISFMISPGMAIYLRGFDREAVASARSIAACMTAVAEELERGMVPVEPDAEAVQS